MNLSSRKNDYMTTLEGRISVGIMLKMHWERSRPRDMLVVIFLIHEFSVCLTYTYRKFCNEDELRLATRLHLVAVMLKLRERSLPDHESAGK